MILDYESDGNRLVYKKFLTFLGHSFLIGLLIVLYIFQNVAVENQKVGLKELEKARLELVREQKELRVEIELLSSPERLEKLAAERFGMIPVTGSKIRIVSVKQP